MEEDKNTSINLRLPEKDKHEKQKKWDKQKAQHKMVEINLNVPAIGININ